MPDSDDGKGRKKAPRGPADGYPRVIAHNETIRFIYDPDTNQVTAQRLHVQQRPDVLENDDTPPDGVARTVGSLSVTAAGREVTAVPQSPYGSTEAPQAVAAEGVPEKIAEHLRAEAQRTGRAAGIDVTTRYTHNLDTNETEQETQNPRKGLRLRERAAAGVQAARGAAAGGLDALAGGVANFEQGQQEAVQQRAATQQAREEAEKELAEAQKEYDEARAEAGTSGRIGSFALRVRGGQEPDRLQQARERLRAAGVSLRRPEPKENVEQTGGAAARLGRFANRSGQGGGQALAQGGRLAEGARHLRKEFQSPGGLFGGTAPKPGGKKKRRSSSSKRKNTGRTPPEKVVVQVVSSHSPSGSNRPSHYRQA